MNTMKAPHVAYASATTVTITAENPGSAIVTDTCEWAHYTGKRSFPYNANNELYAQTITPSAQPFDTVIMEIRKISAPSGVIWIEWQVAAGNLPAGTVLATSEHIASADLPTGARDTQAWRFPGVNTPDGVTQTALVVKTTTPISTSHYFQISYVGTDEYAGGRLCVMQSGSWVGVNTWDVLFQLVDSNSNAVKVGEVEVIDPSYLLDITASGLNGLDAGAAANNTGYYVWMVASACGTTGGGIFSLSATAPKLPEMCCQRRLVGWVYRNDDGEFYEFYMVDGWCWWNADRTGPDFRQVDGGTEVAWDAFTPLAPAIADAVKGGVCIVTAAGYLGNDCVYVRPTGSNWTTGVGSRACGLSDQVNGRAGYAANDVERPLGTGGQLDYKTLSGGAAYWDDQAFHMALPAL